MSSSIGSEATITQSARIPHATQHAFAICIRNPLYILFHGSGLVVLKMIPFVEEVVFPVCCRVGGYGGRPRA